MRNDLPFIYYLFEMYCLLFADDTTFYTTGNDDHDLRNVAKHSLNQGNLKRIIYIKIPERYEKCLWVSSPIK